MNKESVLVRLPSGLKAKIAQRAGAENVSSNQLIVKAIEMYLGIPDYGDAQTALIKCHEQITELTSRVRTLEWQQQSSSVSQMEARLRTLEGWRQSILAQAEQPASPKPFSEGVDDAPDLHGEDLSEPNDETVKDSLEQSHDEAVSGNETDTADQDFEHVSAVGDILSCSTPEVQVGSIVTIRTYSFKEPTEKNVEVLHIGASGTLFKNEEGRKWRQLFRSPQQIEEDSWAPYKSTVRSSSRNHQPKKDKDSDRG